MRVVERAPVIVINGHGAMIVCENKVVTDGVVPLPDSDVPIWTIPEINLTVPAIEL